MSVPQPPGARPAIPQPPLRPQTPSQANVLVGAAQIPISPQEMGRVPDVPAEFLGSPDVAGTSLTICSIYPQKLISREFTHGGRVVRYKIDAGSLESPAYTQVHNTFMVLMNVTPMDVLSAPGTTHVPITAHQIAADLLKQWGGDHPASRNGFIGVFVCKGPRATPEELEAARQKQETFFRTIVNDATAAWADPRRRHNLSLEEPRRALDWMGVKNYKDYPWYTPLTQGVADLDCPACATPMRITAHICPTCRTNVAVYMKDRGVLPIAGTWPGVENELQFLARAKVAS